MNNSQLDPLMTIRLALPRDSRSRGVSPDSAFQDRFAAADPIESEDPPGLGSKSESTSRLSSTENTTPTGDETEHRDDARDDPTSETGASEGDLASTRSNPGDEGHADRSDETNSADGHENDQNDDSTESEKTTPPADGETALEGSQLTLDPPHAAVDSSSVASDAPGAAATPDATTQGDSNGGHSNESMTNQTRVNNQKSTAAEPDVLARRSVATEATSTDAPSIVLSEDASGDEGTPESKRVVAKESASRHEKIEKSASEEGAATGSAVGNRPVRSDDASNESTRHNSRRNGSRRVSQADAVSRADGERLNTVGIGKGADGIQVAAQPQLESGQLDVKWSADSQPSPVDHDPLRSDEGQGRPQAAAGRVLTSSLAPQSLGAAGRLANASGAGNEERLRVDPARFVSRVAKAFQVAEERGGHLRLRLSPPELGSIRLEVGVKQGAVSATIETETMAARRVLLENLPLLRDRLAEQNIRIEQFDVDVRDDTAGSRDGQANSNNDQPYNAGRPEPRRTASEAPDRRAATEPTPQAVNRRGDETLNVVA